MGEQLARLVQGGGFADGDTDPAGPRRPVGDGDHDPPLEACELPELLFCGGWTGTTNWSSSPVVVLVDPSSEASPFPLVVPAEAVPAATDQASAPVPTTAAAPMDTVA